MPKPPRYFWQDRKNHRRYMKWLGEQLGYRSAADWYHVTNQDFKDHNGGAFVLQYNSTVSAAVMAYKPSYDWKEWLFSTTPNKFWHLKKNRQRYMQWLAGRLGFEHPRDWYGVRDRDFRQNSGNALLKLFGNSPMAVVMDCYPRRTWYEWMFARVPRPSGMIRQIAVSIYVGSDNGLGFANPRIGITSPRTISNGTAVLPCL